MPNSELDPFEFRLMRDLKWYLEQHTNPLEPRKARVFHILVSGGKDSMALAHALHRVLTNPLCSFRNEIHLRALHFNHKTRDGESCRDALFVTQALLQLGIPLSVFTRLSPLSKKAGEGESFQSVASKWRHDCCASIHKSSGPRTAFVTAHHRGDQAESLLLNLCRGAGLQGLKGIRKWDPRRAFYRPLLDVPVSNILSYISRRGIRHIEDASNHSLVYARNRVRHEILPLLKTLNPEIEQALVNLSEEAKRALDSRPSLPRTLTLDLWHEEASTDRLAAWISEHHEGLFRSLSRRSLTNLATHLTHWAKQGVKARAQGTPFVSLGGGWRATLQGKAVEIHRESPEASARIENERSESRRLAAGQVATPVGTAYDSSLDV